MTLSEENTESEPELPDVYNVSIEAVRTQTVGMLSTLLNPPKLILTEKGLPRDYHGLAHLVGIEGCKLPYLIYNSDPTKHVLNIWQQKDKEDATVRCLISHLEEMDRFDVIDEIKTLIEEDIKIFTRNKHAIKPVVNLDADHLILTRDDLKRLKDGLEPQHYDAFVLYADDDIDFATQLIDTLENQYKLKLCVKDRDLVVGVFEHESVIKLIAERCNRLVAIITSVFLESNSNKFFCSYAQFLGIEQRHRKIIPCLYQPCIIPPNLKCYFMLDYQRAGKFWNFYEKLRDSIQVPKRPADIMPRSSSPKIEGAPNTKPIAKSLQPKKESVKFNSMVNLNHLPENDPLNNAITSKISPSGSSSSISIQNKNKANKTITWIKNLLTHKTHDIKGEKCSKKSMWPKKFKQKIAVAQ